MQTIIFEDINSDYGYGTYLGLKVIICKRNGYINATKLCAKFGKCLKHWLENRSSKELVEEVSLAGIPATELVNGGSIETHGILTGTYVHPLLITHIASWISAKVAIQVSKIVNEHEIREYKIQLHEKDDKIDFLIRQNQEMMTKMNQSLAQSSAIMALNEELKVDVDLVSTKLDTVVEQRVPPLNSDRDEIFMLFKISQFEYRACRVQRRKRQERIAKYRDLVLEIPNPNSKNLLIRIKKSDLVAEHKIRCYRMRIEVLEEIDLVSEIQRIDGEKRNV